MKTTREKFENVPERKSKWLLSDEFERALTKGWFLQFENIVIKSRKMKSENGKLRENEWAFYDEEGEK